MQEIREELRHDGHAVVDVVATGTFEGAHPLSSSTKLGRLRYASGPDAPFWQVASMNPLPSHQTGSDNLCVLVRSALGRSSVSGRPCTT